MRFKNWKTTLTGVGLIVTGVALYVNGNLEEAIASILGGLGFILAKDYDTTGNSTNATKEGS